MQFGFGIQPLQGSSSCFEVPNYNFTLNCLDFHNNVGYTIYFSVCCLYAQWWVIQEFKEIDY